MLQLTLFPELVTFFFVFRQIDVRPHRWKCVVVFHPDINFFVHCKLGCFSNGRANGNSDQFSRGSCGANWRFVRNNASRINVGVFPSKNSATITIAILFLFCRRIWWNVSNLFDRNHKWACTTKCGNLWIRDSTCLSTLTTRALRGWERAKGNMLFSSKVRKTIISMRGNHAIPSKLAETWMLKDLASQLPLDRL